MPPALATSPNSSIPVGLTARRRLGADELSGAKGHAAGVLFVAPDGDVLLLRRSSSEGNFAGHWALPGGGVEQGESPEFAADREVAEEAGVRLGGSKRLLDQTMTPTGKVFHTYAQPVSEKFVPKLNGEHSGYAWAPMNQLPGPLHPAVGDTLKKRVGIGADMRPEEWQGLRDGFLKWTAEEENEAEHAQDSKLEIDLEDDENQLQKLLAYIKKNSATGHSFDVLVDPSDPDLAKKFYIDGDGAFRVRSIKVDGKTLALDSALRLAFDRESVRTFDQFGRMRVSVANISKATVNPYRGKEIPGSEALGLEPERIYMLLRSPEELEKAAATFNGLQILRKHVAVRADDPQQWDVVGATGTDSRFDDPYLQNGLSLWTAEAIADVESDEKRELSCSYSYRVEMTPGEFNGMRYDGVMRGIVGNHVALVKSGRAGQDVLVGDSGENIMTKPTRLAAHALQLVAAAVSPMLAMDAKIELPKALFLELDTKNFNTKKAALLAGVRSATDGKLRTGLAMDASMETVGKALDSIGSLFDGEKSADAAATEEQGKAMESAVAGNSSIMPKPAGQDFVAKDAGAQLGEFLKSKGMGDADVKAACDMIMPKAATDEEDEEAKKKAAEEKTAKDAEVDALKKANEAKDAAMKNMVDKPAMDAAIDAAVKKVRADERGVRTAIDKVRPYVGELPATLAFDSAEDVFRHTLKAMGVPEADKLHKDALEPVLNAQVKPGARPSGEPRLAMDAAGAKSFAERYPDAQRIGSA